MIILSDRNTGAVLGEISRADFTVIHEILEEETEGDVDYYIQEPALELLSQAGLSPDAHLLLTKALGDHADLEFGWEQPVDSDTGLKGTITAEGGARPAPGLVVEARYQEERYWTFTREDGCFELRLPAEERSYVIRVASMGDKELWSDSLDVQAGQISKLGELALEGLVEHA
jgi:hypothetical protein